MYDKSIQAEQLDEEQSESQNAFDRSRIAAEIALKDWFVDILKASLVKVKQKKFDEKFPKQTTEDAWQRFAIRFDFILNQIAKYASSMPRCITKFLSDVTFGKSAIPSEFMVPFESQIITPSLSKTRKLFPIWAIKELDQKPLLRNSEIERRKRQTTLICSVFIISKVFA